MAAAHDGRADVAYGICLAVDGFLKLQRTLQQRLFPDLWQVRAQFFAGHDAPPAVGGASPAR